ncbi:MAG: SDR family NAD(P)-dependent oxidoreductase, partial [Steroidobacteraceae bacterium]
IQVILPSDRQAIPLCGLSGILKTAQREKNELAVQIVAVERSADPETIVRRANENQGAPDEIIRYVDGVRYVEQLSLLGSPEAAADVVPRLPSLPWKNGGVYLITGGAGGLGRLFAEEIGAQTSQATLVLVGRSQLDDVARNRLASAAAQGTNVRYVAADVSRRDDVVPLVDRIVREHGRLDGVIHCAGVLRDAFILKKDPEELRAVFAPKVAGIVNLDLATARLTLDFFVVFSSQAGVFGNPGQVDYAAANAYMDRYAEFRRTLALEGRRHGRTLSINWPLWQSGGMRVAAEVQENLRETHGLTPMSTAAGLAAFYSAYDSDHAQVCVTAGGLERMRKLSQLRSSPERAAVPSRTTPRAGRADTMSIEESLEGHFCAILHLERGDFNRETTFAELGINSVSAIELVEAINRAYGLRLPTSVIFEFSSIRLLADYVARSLPADHTAEADFGAPAAVTVAAAHPRFETGTPRGASDLHRSASSEADATRTAIAPSTSAGLPGNDIAIIGLSCRSAGASNPQEFWDLIRNGRECIDYIKDQRWLDVLSRHRLDRTVRYGAMAETDCFDSSFFNISPREAEAMDPMQRIVLEQCYAALE